MDYGIPDPASNMGGSYADAVTRTNPTPTRAGNGGTSTADPRGWFGAPIRSGGIEFLPGIGYRRNKGKDANGNPIYQDLLPHEATGKYSYDREKAKLDQDKATEKENALDARIDKRDKADREKWDAAQSAEKERLRLAGVASQQTGAQIAGTLESIRNTGAIAVGQLTLSNTIETNRNNQASDQLQHQQKVHQDDVTDRRDQRTLDRAALDASNKLGQDKLASENLHFQQQLEQDQRASRRTQVLGALTLISQAAARF